MSKCNVLISVTILIELILICVSEIVKKPHIIFIVADDLGWNDVGFHGSAEIPTPNIDALAYSGIILNNYYVHPLSTPTRAAIMTGKYAIHTGMQHDDLSPSEPRGLPLTDKILPMYLKDLGYRTHMVGKWDLGFYKKDYTPLYRGFDSHIGFWTGKHDYFDHTNSGKLYWGLDMRRGLSISHDSHGKYTTDLFAYESAKIITEHDRSTPLFLYIAHAAVHSGNNYNPLPAPDMTVRRMSHISDFNRRKFAAMTVHLDKSVGVVVEALEKRNMLNNSIIIFTTDNGGPAQGFNMNAASNWPLRGVKNTLWEGGVRGTAFLWSPLLEKPNRVAKQMMHAVDWLPTLYRLVGGDPNTFHISRLDGKDLWNSLSRDVKSDRTEILHNIDDIFGSAALTVGDWKVIKGSHYNGQWDKWYGPKGDIDENSYDINAIESCESGKSLKNMEILPTSEEIINIRRGATIDCGFQSMNMFPCKPLEKPCLFQITEDPCEMSNLQEKYPNMLSMMLELLNLYNITVLPPANKALEPKADPMLWNYTWTNYGDYLGL